MATIKTTKVFVGNLSFKTTTDELKNQFQKAVGEVTNANIITRGSRSLGYGFVDFNTEDEARKAVVEMNKKKIDEREINVEIARPRDESKPASVPISSVRGRGPSYYRGGRGGYGRGRYGGRGGYRRGGGGMGFRRRPRPPIRRPVSTEGRAQSTSTLFVANLPYSLEDEGLAKIFTGLTVKHAHVIRRPNGRSKGFGFVEFDSAEDQQKGLNGEKKTVEGRELVIKVALTDESTKSDAPAPSTTTTTTTTSTSLPRTAPPSVATSAVVANSSPKVSSPSGKNPTK